MTGRATGPDWKDVAPRIERLVADARAMLEQDQDAIATARLRGRIAALREVLAFAAPPPPAAPSPPPAYDC